MKEPSKEAQMVASELSDEYIKTMRKDNLFRNDRNDRMIELFRRGVKIAIISEISGCPRSTVEMIVMKKNKYQTKPFTV